MGPVHVGQGPARTQKRFSANARASDYLTPATVVTILAGVSKREMRPFNVTRIRSSPRIAAGFILRRKACWAKSSLNNCPSEVLRLPTFYTEGE